MTENPTRQPKVARSVRRGRPALYTQYAADQAIWNTPAKRAWSGALLLLMLVAPFLPFVSRSQEADLTLVFIYAIGGIGLNLVTGYAGQVSIGHAFFLGIGAFTGGLIGGSATSSVLGFELDMILWLPAAGLVTMLIGLAIAPLAARVRGLYLAILTLGLVFIGEHLFKELTFLTGGFGVGRRGPEPSLLGLNLGDRYAPFGIEMDGETPFYLFCLLLLVGMGILARNLVRSRMGRAFAAVRDRDIAAEVMGVPLLRTKVIAFGVSSFYAGIAGGLFAVSAGQITPENFGGLGGLLLSVEFLAVILIGGIATISGPIIGAAFVILMPRLIQAYSGSLPFLGDGGLLSPTQLEGMLFGALIVLFLVLEPRGLFGLWVRVRNYWKAWPFSY